MTYLLAICDKVEDVCRNVLNLQVLNIHINGKSISSTLHYFFMDKTGETVILKAADAAHPGRFNIIRDRQTGILTNSPVYSEQLENLAWFISQLPELRCGDGMTPCTSLNIDGTVIEADAGAPHVCGTGTFPASYSSYDRFVRLAVLKALNNNGRNFSDEKMLPYGMGIMRSVFEPRNQGIFHYVKLDEDGKLLGKGDGYTQYTIVYDLENQALHLQPYDSLDWTKLSISDCSKEDIEQHQIK